MLIDVHAHFLHDRTPRADWQARNASRLRAGERVGITIHVASILGSWGLTSPTYFPSLPDLRYANDSLLALQRLHPARIRGYVTVNPNYADEALAEIRRCLDAGMIGIKLAASRRADDPLLDPICRLAVDRGVPILHHVWQHRRRDYAGQEASDARELGRLAARHPEARFLLAHIGGGGDWLHSLHAVRDVVNVHEVGGCVQFEFDGGDDEQVSLVSRLIAAGFPVLEFSARRAGLEDLFIEITEGVAQ